MTTSSHRPRRISLRALAVELGSHHSTLSAAAHDGRLHEGIRLDKRGRVVVVDADAAARNWRAVHVPQILELERLESRQRRAKPAPHVEEPREVAETILNGALVRAALDGVKDRRAAARAYLDRVLVHLRAEARIWSAGDEALQIAESTVRETVEDIVTLTQDERER